MWGVSRDVGNYVMIWMSNHSTQEKMYVMTYPIPSFCETLLANEAICSHIEQNGDVPVTLMVLALDVNYCMHFFITLNGFGR